MLDEIVAAFRDNAIQTAGKVALCGGRTVISRSDVEEAMMWEAHHCFERDAEGDEWTFVSEVDAIKEGWEGWTPNDPLKRLIKAIVTKCLRA